MTTEEKIVLASNYFCKRRWLLWNPSKKKQNRNVQTFSRGVKFAGDNVITNHHWAEKTFSSNR